MVQSITHYDGALHTTITHGPSGAVIATDAPVDNHGTGENFSPTDLVAAALGSCMATVMGIVAERHTWNLSGLTIRVEKTMVADPVRRIGALSVLVNMPDGLAAEQRQMLENAARTCPVAQSLHPAVILQTEFVYRKP